MKPYPPSAGTFSTTLGGLVLFLILGMGWAGCDTSNNSDSDPAVPAETSDPASLVKSAQEKQAVGAFDSAIEELNRALAVKADFVPAHFLMGEVYNEWDRREEAVAAYKKTIELDPDHLEARLSLADVYDKMIRNSLALEQLLVVARSRPKDTEVHFKIALEYWYLQQLENCAVAYRKVIELNPDHLQAHLNLASVYEAMKDWDQALREIGLSIQLAESKGNAQGVSIAKNKLKFFKGRATMTEEDILRKTSPPFE